MSRKWSKPRVDKSGEVRVHRVVCALDCGTVVNPDTVRAQMEGGIIFGLTAALKTEITLKNGRVKQSNFDDYPMLRIFESPASLKSISSRARKVPPASANPAFRRSLPLWQTRLFAATGKRIRRLPIRPGDLTEKKSAKS